VLRLVHTADWHLGHTLHGADRQFEHREFLNWLADLLESEQANALVIAGDIFDSANPPASAQRMLYRFLAGVGRRLPGLDVVIIAGNHDSPGRLEAPAPLLEGLGARVVGLLPRSSDGSLETDRIVMPLSGDDGEPAAWCAAVPYLRPADLAPCPDADDPLIAGVAAVYHDVLEDARRRAGDLPVVALGHCYMTGGRLSELSERRILGGHQHALPASIFPDDVAYVALGHLHRAQRVAGRDAVRYSGSPIPLALDEASSHHQVSMVEIDGSNLQVEARPIPRTVEILQIPSSGSGSLEDVLGGLAELELDEALPRERWPFLGVDVRLDGPQPDLRRQVEEAIEGRPVRLARVRVVRDHDRGSLADQAPAERLDAIRPEEVFRRRWQREADGEPPTDLLEAFVELVREVEEAET